MNIKTNLKKGYKRKIIKTLHVTGLLLFRDMRMMVEDTEKIEMYHRSAHELEEKGYVKICRSNGEKYLRLSMYKAHEAEYREYFGDAYVDYYLRTYDNLHMFQETTQNRSKLSSEEKEREWDKRTDNNKKLAEANTRLIMYLGGYIYVDRLPLWRNKTIEGIENTESTESDKELLSESENIAHFQIGDNIFYNNLEVKNVRAGFENLRPSRTNGLLVSDGGDFLVYNTQNRLLQWATGPENTYSYYVKMLMDKWSDRERKEYVSSFHVQKKPMIILGKQEALLRLCTEKNIRVQLAKGKPLLSTENVDHSIFPVLSDKNGIPVLHFLTSPQLNIRSETLLKELNPEFTKDKYEKKFRSGYIEKNGEQISVLNFMIPDIAKLSAFIKHELTAIPTDYEYLAEIYCIMEYEWYVNEVIEYYKKEFGIQSVASECIRVYAINKELL